MNVGCRLKRLKRMRLHDRHCFTEGKAEGGEAWKDREATEREVELRSFSRVRRLRVRKLYRSVYSSVQNLLVSCEHGAEHAVSCRERNEEDQADNDAVPVPVQGVSEEERNGSIISFFLVSPCHLSSRRVFWEEECVWDHSS